MEFTWDGMYFIKVNGLWISKNLAMRGPTGDMLDKVVPEPWQSKIEAAFRSQVKNEEPEKIIKKNKKQAAIKTTADTKDVVQEKVSLADLAKLHKENNKSAAKRKKSGVIGGLKLFNGS